jgi:hypothetical protein
VKLQLNAFQFVKRKGKVLAPASVKLIKLMHCRIGEIRFAINRDVKKAATRREGPKAVNNQDVQTMGLKHENSLDLIHELVVINKLGN